MENWALRLVLTLIGMMIVWLGLNVALGGIPTLGWQGPADFMSVTNEGAFAVQDNHIRFIGGVWTSVGLFMLFGAAKLHQLATVLKTLLAMVFIGGLARFSAADSELIMSANIAPSLIAELIVLPLIGGWIHHATRSN